MKEWTGLALDGFNEDNIRAFVRDLYMIFVDRDPDPEGLSHYTSLLKSGASVAETIATFARSDEHMQKERSKLLLELIAQRSWNSETAPDTSSWAGSVHFPEDYKPPGEAGRSYLYR